MKKELTKRILSSIILIPISLFFIVKGSYLFILFISICFCVIGYEWHSMAKKKPYYFFGFIFLIFSFLSILEIRFNSELDYFLLLLITIICVSTDIGGYVFGKIFKGPKLTKFSPKKTYSGMIGGFFLTFICLYIYFQLYNQQFTIKWFIFIFVISGVSQLGDIIISYFKRLSNLKDTGKIIPGHGGLLDRVDGMIFAFPSSYLIILFNIIS